MLGTMLKGNGGNGAYLMYGINCAGVGVGGSYFLVPFTCVQPLSVYCVVKMCTQHTA